MADYANKYVDSVGVKHLWNKADDTFIKKESGKGLSEQNYTAAEKEKLAELENYELPVASNEVMGGIKVGRNLTMDANGFLNATAEPISEFDWEDVLNTPSTLEGYGITDAVTKTELEEVKTAVSKVYKYKGKVATVADLDNIENPKNGDVYDVEEDGTNYAWNETENRWDNLGTIVKIDSLSVDELDLILGSASTPAALKKLIEDGGKVDLAADMTLSEPLTLDKDTVLDLGGHTLSGTGNGYLLTANGAKLTLKNGNINVAKRVAQAENGGEVIVESGNYVSNDSAFAAIGAGSKITFKNGSISAREGGLLAFDGATVQIDNGHVECSDNFTIATNGTSGRGGNTIVMNGGELVGHIQSAGYEACGIYIANNDSFEMNGGSIVADGGCGILMRAGNVVINNGNIEAKTGSHVPGWVGDNKTKMSASAVIYHESANYPGKAGMSLTINGGTFKGANKAVEILSNEATPNVTINGGTFDPQL